MSEELLTDTLVAGENVQPVGTDTDAEVDTKAKSERSVTPSAPSAPSEPNVENKDGKLFVDGVRVYSRDDTNRIAANAKKEAESRILSDLEVDSIDQIKTVVNQLRNAPEGDGQSLNVNALKDAVKKKEQTVEELTKELNTVRTEYALKEHIGALKDNMPSAWNVDQKSAVVDLMKARDMLHLEGNTFAIKQGEDYFTTDGETPDYKTAVEAVGKGLGLPFAKRGVDTFDADKQPTNSGVKKAVDQGRLKTDPQYRAAYVTLREGNKNIARTDLTDAMVLETMKKYVRGSTAEKLLI